jgi:hypothetical protein
MKKKINMNLKEQIRRILREEMDKTQIITLVLETLELVQNERICGFEVISPEKNTEKFYYNNKQNIPYKVKVYYVAGPASEYWPRTQAEFNKEIAIISEIQNYVKGSVGISVGVDIMNVSSCKHYKWITEPFK